MLGRVLPESRYISAGSCRSKAILGRVLPKRALKALCINTFEALQTVFKQIFKTTNSCVLF
jgi:hypothetical protein